MTEIKLLRGSSNNIDSVIKEDGQLLFTIDGDNLEIYHDYLDGNEVVRKKTQLNTVFQGATDNTNGTVGLVPRPVAGQESLFLRADGTWQPTNTTATLGDVSGSISTNKNTVTLTWSDPADVEVDGVILARWGGTKVVRKIGSAPNDVTDGTLVVHSRIRDQYSSTGYVDSGLQYDTTYYYGFFPYTSEGNTTMGSVFNSTPTRIVISTLPSQSGTETYSGDTITASFNNYNPDTLVVSDDEQINAGTYIANFTPRNGYKWWDDTITSKEVQWTINKATLPVPSVKSSVTLTYSGSIIDAVAAGKFNDYDSNKMTVSGHTATNAGNHTATFSLIDSNNYQWNGPTTADRDVIWAIAKAQGTLTLVNTSQSSVTLDSDHASITVNFTKYGDGIVSRTIGDSSICSATMSGDSVIIATNDETSGETTVTLTLSETTNYLGTTLVITVIGDYAKGVPWATGADADIVAMIQLADQGKLDPREYWAVGQERAFSLSAMSATGVGESHVAQNVTMVLVDKDNTNYTYVTTPASGRTYPYFIVQQKNGLANGTSGEFGYMNSSNTNSGSWNGCARRTWCNNVYRSAIPSTIRDIFHQVKVKTAQTYNGSTIQESNDYFFLPAAAEVFKGDSSYGQGGSAGQQTAYSNLTEWNALSRWEYYATTSNRVKNQGNGGSAYSWWERSPGYSGASAFCFVDSDGTAHRSGASVTLLIAPAGCI